jgi:hypothetical protein
MAIEILEFKEREGGVLKGHLKVRLTKIGLEIYGVALFDKGAGKWISLPRKDYTKKDGTKGWNDILKFTDFDVFKQFQAEVLAALDEYLKKGPEPEKEEDTDVPF